jgi:hypothetical protein
VAVSFLDDIEGKAEGLIGDDRTGGRFADQVKGVQ